MLPPLQNNEHGAHSNIRILSIPPAPLDSEQTDNLECDIQVVSLDNLPEYETLSYVWGDEAGRAPIFVSGHRIEISRSLRGALRRLQLPDRHRLLWIDQICIDQQNLEEKAEQVRFMSAIYTKCSRCIAWMGEVRNHIPMADADAAMQLIQYMAAASRAQDPNTEPLPPIFPARFGAAIEAMKSISPVANKWWYRIWTVQEATLPEHVCLQWGNFELPWSTLLQVREALVSRLSQSLHQMITQHPASVRFLNILIAHITWLHGAKLRYGDVFERIHLFRFRRATNERDKIYGLLGVCERGRLPITERCDYSIPTSQVFNTLTRELIIDRKWLRPLTNTPRQQPFESTPNIATWALDLSFSTPKYSPDVYYLMHVYNEYKASEGLGPIDLDVIKAEIGQAKLTLTGTYVDAIVQTQDGLRTADVADFAQMTATETLLHNWYAAAVGCPFSSHDLDGSVSKDLYPDSTYTRAEAFARLVMGDVVRDGEQRPERKSNGNDVQDVWKIMRREIDHVEFETRRTIYGMMANQNMFVTKTGLMGQGHTETEIGDQVWVFRGGNVPFVIRPQKGEGEDGYTFVGQCYVQGIMQGEVGSKKDLVQKTVSLY